MADVFEPEVRSYVMGRIKSRNTKPEIAVRKFLHARGYRFNLHGKFKSGILPGKPDIVLPKYRTLIFVHGCFWHAHADCKHFSIPETRREWWEKKLLGNRARDERHRKALQEMGWRVHVIWTCQMKSKTDMATVHEALLNLLSDPLPTTGQSRERRKDL